MRRFRFLSLIALPLAALGCNNNGDTFIVNSDCGLIRSDLTGTFTVVFAPGNTTLLNCSNPAAEGKIVTVTSAPLDFKQIQVFASAFNTGFSFSDGTSPRDLFGNSEIDSCAMSFSVLDDEGVYLNCFGILDRPSRTVRAACDSGAVLQTPLTDPPVIVADCDLIPNLLNTLTIH